MAAIPEKRGTSIRRINRVMVLFAAVLAWSLSTELFSREQLMIERIASLPSLTGTAPANPVWSPDSSHLAFLWNEEAMPFRDVWVVAAQSRALKRVTDMARDFPYPEREVKDVYTKLVQEAAVRARGGVSSILWTPDSKSLIIRYRGEMFRVDADGKNLRRLTETGRGAYALAFSPDGRFLSYLKDEDLWLWNQETGQLIQATQKAKPAVGAVQGSTYSGIDAGFSSYKWSPGSQHIALSFQDRSHSRTLVFPNYLTEEVTVHERQRNYTSDKNLILEMSIYSLKDASLKTLNLEGKRERLVGNYNWSPDGGNLLIDQNADQAPRRWIYVVNARDGRVQELWKDTNKQQSYTTPWNSVWRSDGKGILFLSDLDGYIHLYSIALDDGAIKQLTQGNWSIISQQGYSPAKLVLNIPTKEIFTVASKKNPYERQVYKISENGGLFQQVTSLAGCHSPYVAPDGKKIAVLRSSDLTPTELYITDTSGKSAEQRITHSPPKEFNDYKWIEPQYVTFKSRVDDATLHGRLLLPPDLDKSKKYPVILGPVYFDTVRNRWSGTYGTLQQYLALEGGYIGFHVDSRGSSGYGADFRYKFQYNCGAIDIEDLHSGVEYLKTLSYVDPERIGIWGSSYGGLLTIHSLFKKPGVYKAGVAGAPATNVWHAGPSEFRLFGDAEEHADAYRLGSAYCYGEDLEDHLMIIHGMQDSTVLFRDSIALAEKLMLLGKDFDLVIAPSATHGWSRKDYAALYLLRKLVGHFDRYLGRGPK